MTWTLVSRVYLLREIATMVRRRRLSKPLRSLLAQSDIKPLLALFLHLVLEEVNEAVYRDRVASGKHQPPHGDTPPVHGVTFSKPVNPKPLQPAPHR